MIARPAWRDEARQRAVAQFRAAWTLAPVAGRAAVADAAARGTIGHRWEIGRHACVLALLVGPVLRPGESPKAGAYRLFGCEITEDFPVTWDNAGVTAADLLGSVNAPASPAAWRGLPAPQGG
ncbi:MAG: hypothetical protein U0531_05630 [Dehalococcoidia bacterium]